eukprot:994988_1
MKSRKSYSEWFFSQLEQLDELRSSTSAVAPREEIIHRVFVKLEHCDPTWRVQVDALDTFITILERKPELVHGTRNFVDLLISLIEKIERLAKTSSRYDDDVIGGHLISVEGKLFRLLDIAGRYALTVKSVTRLLAFLPESVKGSVRSHILPLVLTTLRGLSAEPSTRHRHSDAQAVTTNSAFPRAVFEFNGIGARLTVGLVRPASGESGWPFQKGYTFCAWICWSNEGLKDRRQSRCLFSLLNPEGHGFEICLSSSGIIVVRSFSRSKRLEHSILDSPLHQKRWYFISVSHVRVQSFTRNTGTSHIFIDRWVCCLLKSATLSTGYFSAETWWNRWAGRMVPELTNRLLSGSNVGG